MDNYLASVHCVPTEVWGFWKKRCTETARRTLMADVRNGGYVAQSAIRDIRRLQGGFALCLLGLVSF